MFAIIISEKGGAERREFFDKSEVSVGRVQGNDLLLPKGNVSKHHAQLVSRDGRFIVKDLKSTNGTYVNGRKIVQATLLREGDRIYVGDFVLRLEIADPSAARASHGMGGPAPLPATPTAGDLGTHWDGEFTAKREAISLDPENATGRREAVHPPGIPSPPPARLPLSSESSSPSRPNLPAFGRVTPGDRQGFLPRSMALGLLTEHLSGAVDLSSLSFGAEPDAGLAQQLERAIRDTAQMLHEQGQLPAGTDLEGLIRDATRELFGLGALETLLEDEEIHEVRVFGHDRVSALRAGEAVTVDPTFSSDEALFRIVARMCRQAGQPLSDDETIVERQLPSGLWMQAIVPEAAVYGPVLLLRRRRRVDAGLDELVRAGSLSRAMATFLHHCVGTRANILVVGPWDATASLVAALTAAGNPDDHLVAIQQVDELWGIEPPPLCLRMPQAAADANRVLRAAGRFHPDRLVISPVSGAVAAGLCALIAEGAQGVIATAHAPSLRHAAERLVPDLISARPGLGQKAAAAWLAGSFDVAVEVTRLRDRKLRTTRIAELFPTDTGTIGTQDIFAFGAERTGPGESVDGAFVASGKIPRMIQERGMHGNGIDLGLFKRS